MATLESIKVLAQEFLSEADRLSSQVSAYINGSNRQEDSEAYYYLKSLDKKMIDEINRYYGCREYSYGLNYEVAEYFAE